MTAVSTVKSVVGPMDALMSLGQLTFLTQPVGILGLPLTVNPVVGVLTETGVLDVGYVGSVTLSVTSGGTISGAVTVAVVLGVATFLGLTIGGSSGVQIIASAPGNAPATSNPL